MPNLPHRVPCRVDVNREGVEPVDVRPGREIPGSKSLSAEASTWSRSCNGDSLAAGDQLS
ncbi:hypothetical protein C0J52_00437 [Blattella germanica]|nr:hypothetical protein C0J52_00437 [Blattella germanica]